MKLAGISTTLPMFSGLDNIFYNFYLQALSLANLSPLSASAVISPSTECPSESVMFQCVMILIVPINLNLKKKSPRILLCIWPLYQEFSIHPWCSCHRCQVSCGARLEQGADLSSCADIVAFCFWKIAKEEATEQLGMWFSGSVVQCFLSFYPQHEWGVSLHGNYLMANVENFGL